MRKHLLGLILVSIPLQLLGAEPPDAQAREATALINAARQSGEEGYFYRVEAQYRGALRIIERISGGVSSCARAHSGDGLIALLEPAATGSDGSCADGATSLIR